MSSQRKLIRDKVAALLLAGGGISGIGTRIFTNRMRKVFASELPCIVIYSRTESAEINVAGPREYKRTLKMAIEIIDKYDDVSEDTLDDAVDDRLDEIAEEVEQRLMRNETLDGLAADLILSDTEIDFNPEGEQPTGAARLTFDVEYNTLAPIEQLGLDAFEQAHVEYTLQPDNQQEKAVDDIDLPQI
jgi:hypothetical protein